MNHPFFAPAPAGALFPGVRATHKKTGRTALVIGKPEGLSERVPLVPVFVENSTRRELWPLRFTSALPPERQHTRLGGQYQAPAGYPLRAPEKL